MSMSLLMSSKHPKTLFESDCIIRLQIRLHCKSKKSWTRLHPRNFEKNKFIPGKASFTFRIQSSENCLETEGSDEKYKIKKM